MPWPAGSHLTNISPCSERAAVSAIHTLNHSGGPWRVRMLSVDVGKASRLSRAHTTGERAPTSSIAMTTNGKMPGNLGRAAGTDGWGGGEIIGACES